MHRVLAEGGRFNFHAMWKLCYNLNKVSRLCVLSAEERRAVAVLSGFSGWIGRLRRIGKKRIFALLKRAAIMV